MTSRAGTPGTEHRTTTEPISQAGFTLIELMLVLLLLGTLASLVVPRLHLSRGNLLFQESSRLLLADLERARLEAIQSGTQREVVFTRPSEGTYEVHRFWRRESNPWDFANKDDQWTSPVQEIQEHKLPGNVRLETSVPRIFFLPDGSATSCVIKVLGQDGMQRSLVFVDRITGIARRLESRGNGP